MYNKILILVALLWAYVGASAQSSDVTLFYANGGQKCIIHKTLWKGVKDTTYTITVGISGVGGSFMPEKIYTRKGNDSVQTITDTITDGASLAGLPVAQNVCVMVRLVSTGIVDTFSNQLCGINITDSVVKPTISFISNPTIQTNGEISCFVKVKTNGDAYVFKYAAYDSARALTNKNPDSIYVAGSTNPVNIKVVFAVNIATGTRLYCRVLIRNIAGKDSTVIVKSDLFLPKQQASTEIDSVLQRTNNSLKIRVSSIGFGLPTKTWLTYHKLNSTIWFYSDTINTTGDSIQYPVFLLSGLESETGYEFRSYSLNALGTGCSMNVTAYTTKTQNPGVFSANITKVEPGLYRDFTLYFTVTNKNGTKSTVWPLVSNDLSFAVADPLKNFVINGTVEQKVEKFTLNNTYTTKRYYIRIQGMNDAGQTMASNDITLDLRAWSVGINPRNQSVDLQSEVGATYQLFDINGKLVLEGVTVEAHEEISLSGLPAGTYVYKLSKGDLVTIGKIAKN